ncbi:hypothetical protein [Saccharothrix australiensis]|uniref:Uncharacterized protein n=1 Tax=Saccharothrix australiensis TaxID=2072 RepID=A0A495VM35_9PSEU|nr:hypothetical protein [Saccharothrix australiensis]RKT49276.1 hypothetical protein C8E97_6772 [Saccharothrix australiensis]RKT49375.1 hypothetical protein C8E97_6754 [Saccharothrix australiensis]
MAGWRLADDDPRPAQGLDEETTELLERYLAESDPAGDGDAGASSR